MCSAPATAQKPTGSGRGDQSQFADGNAGKKETYKPGNAWTLSYPLGTHEQSTLDTLLYNYQRQFIPAMNSDAWATTGSLGAEGLTCSISKGRSRRRSSSKMPSSTISLLSEKRNSIMCTSR